MLTSHREGPAPLLTSPKPAFIVLLIIAIFAFPADSPGKTESGPSLASGEWVWQNPVPPPFPLTEVTFVDASRGFIVGDQGIILTTADGGVTWTEQDGQTESNLRGVSFANALLGVVVGDSGTILRTTDGGVTWTSIVSGVASRLRDVQMLDTINGTAVGDNGTILRTTDGGISWAPQTSGVLVDLFALQFIDGNVGTIVGGISYYGTILHSEDGGATWLAQYPALTPVLRDVTFTSGGHGVAVGEFGTVMETADGGATWTPLPNPTFDEHFTGVDFINPTTGMAVGPLNRIYRTFDGGTSWTAVVVESAYRSVFSVTSSVSVAVGNGGRILRTTNNGSSWSDARQGPVVQLTGVYYTDALTGTVTGDGGLIIRTADGGDTWIEQNSGTSEYLRDVAFASASAGVVSGSGGVILTTDNAGSTWTQRPTGTAADLFAIEMMSATTGTVVGDFGTILQTVDGGVSWTSLVNPATGTGATLRSVSFGSASVGLIAGGDGLILRTTNGGISWDVQTSGIAERLYDVYMASAAIATAVGDDGIILRSIDGGVTWSPQSSGNSARLIDVRFVTPSWGVAVGDFGTILRTANGGASWDYEYSGANLSLYSVFFPEPTICTLTGVGGAILRAVSDTEPPPSLEEFPVVDSVEDVGNDQGRRVRIGWTRSLWDGPDDGVTITGYAIYRQQQPGLAPPAAAVLEAPARSAQLMGWDYLLTVPARGDDTYQTVVSTLCDSTISAGVCWSTFLVSALTPDPLTFYDSPPDSGYSIDNLSPAAPQSVQVLYHTGLGNHITWEPPSDPDLDYYRVYRRSDGETEGTVVCTTTQEEWNDPGHDGPGVLYTVAGVDHSGNEGPHGAPDNASGAGDNPMPARVMLYQNAPNPFNPTTTIRYYIPDAATVVLRVYDATGRTVRNLVDDRIPAGPHEVRWQGLNDHGQRVSSGIYFYRLIAGGVSETRKMVLLK